MPPLFINSMDEQFKNRDCRVKYQLAGACQDMMSLKDMDNSVMTNELVLLQFPTDPWLMSPVIF